MILSHGVNFVLMGHRHVERALRANKTALVNVGATSRIRTRGLSHSFSVIDVFTNGKVRVTEKNITEGKDILRLDYDDKIYVPTQNIYI